MNGGRRFTDLRNSVGGYTFAASQEGKLLYGSFTTEMLGQPMNTLFTGGSTTRPTLGIRVSGPFFAFSGATEVRTSNGAAPEPVETCECDDNTIVTADDGSQIAFVGTCDSGMRGLWVVDQEAMDASSRAELVDTDLENLALLAADSGTETVLLQNEHGFPVHGFFDEAGTIAQDTKQLPLGERLPIPLTTNAVEFRDQAAISPSGEWAVWATVGGTAEEPLYQISRVRVRNRPRAVR